MIRIDLHSVTMAECILLLVLVHQSNNQFEKKRPDSEKCIAHNSQVELQIFLFAKQDFSLTHKIKL